MTTISLRLKEADAMLIKKYAYMKRLTVSELLRQTVMDCIMEEFDLHAYQNAAAAFQGNPATYTHKEAGEMLEVTP